MLDVCATPPLAQGCQKGARHLGAGREAYLRSCHSTAWALPASAFAAAAEQHPPLATPAELWPLSGSQQQVRRPPAGGAVARTFLHVCESEVSHVSADMTDLEGLHTVHVYAGIVVELSLARWGPGRPPPQSLDLDVYCSSL